MLLLVTIDSVACATWLNERESPRKSNQAVPGRLDLWCNGRFIAMWSCWNGCCLRSGKRPVIVQMWYIFEQLSIIIIKTTLNAVGVAPRVEKSPN